MKTIKLVVFLFLIILLVWMPLHRSSHPSSCSIAACCGKACSLEDRPNFNNWGRRGIGLDWPVLTRRGLGRTSEVRHHTWYLGASGGSEEKTGQRHGGRGLVNVWSTVSSESNAKYRVTRHYQKYKMEQTTG